MKRLGPGFRREERSKRGETVIITIWNSAKLARQLRDDAVSEPQKFAYYFIIFLFVTLLGTRSFNTFIAAPMTVWDYNMDGVGVIAFVLGTRLLFRANQSGDGKSFIERAICLFLPVSVQVVLSIVVIYILVGIAGGLGQSLAQEPAGNYGDAMTMQTTAADLVITTAALLYFYYRMIRSMRIASGAKD